MFKNSTFELPPLTDLIKKGNTIRIYISDSIGEAKTTYTAGVATGDFNENGIPIVQPSDPYRLAYDYYLPESKIQFLTGARPVIVSRNFMKSGYNINTAPGGGGRPLKIKM